MRKDYPVENKIDEFLGSLSRQQKRHDMKDVTELLTTARQAVVRWRIAYELNEELIARLRTAIEEAKLAFDEIYDSPDSNLKIMRISEEASDKLRNALEGKE